MVRLSSIFQLIIVCALGLTPCFAEQPAPVEAPPPLSAAQLDSLTAPIALYPDALIAQILTAATYPLEVVEAAHWLEDPANASLKGDALAAALEHEDWDLSVKSLVPFPDTLGMMERNLSWTEQIGDAFLAQQTDVMDSVQRLRQRAVSAGTLKSSPEQIVWNQDDEIVVEPVNPDVVYVPYYNPSVIYGPWPWPGYAPFYFPPPPGIYVSGPAIVFGVGFSVIRPLWGWSYWSWHRHGLFIPPHLPHTWPLRPGPWRHDPGHRRGLPYRGLPYEGRDHGPTRPGRPFPPARPPTPRAPPSVRPRGEFPPRHAPPPTSPRLGTQPPAHRPGPPQGAPDSNRFHPRPPPARPRSPTGPSTQGVPPVGRVHEGPARTTPRIGSTGPRAQPPTLGAPRGGRADRPAPNPTPPNRSAAPRGQERPRTG